MADPRSIAKSLGPWVALLLVVVLFVVSRSVCISAWLADGIATRTCPDGDVRPTLAVDGSLRRGTEGTLQVRAIGHFTTGPADQDLTAPIRRFRPVATLRTQGGVETALDLDWRSTAPGTKEAKVRLPADLADGDHVLLVRAVTAAGETSTEVPLAVFAPAKVHVLTDRPLYQPGDTVQLRSVVFRAADLVPLGSRPGRFRITDPNGDLLLDERADADGWAVASRSFPIDPLAATGDWTLSWVSGDARGDTQFRVEPFELPRFRIEAQPDAPFYRVGETPHVSGRVTYSSGAPVAGADLAIDWDSSGEWPVPTSWLQGDLPAAARARADGRFELALPEVPADLVGQATLRGAVTATDSAGDRVGGSLSVLLSEDAILVDTLTELPGGGLVQGFNNRLYLRVRTADGRTLDGVDLRVDKAWDPQDEPIVAKTDEDGVASIQVDPGPPVTVLVPAMPVRPAPLPPAVSLVDARELVHNEDLSLADRRALDRWLSALKPCARYVADSELTVALGVRVAPTGAVQAVSAGASALEQCAARTVRAERLSAGDARVLALRYIFRPPDLPRFQLVSIEGQPWTPPELSALVAERLLDARACLSRTVPSEMYPWVLAWTGKRQSKALALDWTATDAARDGSLACVAGRFAGLQLVGPAQSDASGVVHLMVQAAPTRELSKPSPTAMLGYELDARASRGDEELGRTRIRLQPGAVPPLRLRLDPPIAAPGGELALEILRGPDFTGELPKKLALVHDQAKPIEADVKERKAHFALPDDAAGWYAVQWNGAQAFAYVPESGELSVTLTPAEATLRPGTMGSLAVRTEAAGKGVEAAVAIIGLDESLGQLVPLPGPDALDGLRLLPASQGEAFPSLDVGALTMGRIRGANARAATVLRVSALPSAADRDAWVAVHGAPPFDPIGPLTDAFYAVLASLHAHVRAWEQSAEPGKMLELDAYAKLWDQSLDEVGTADDAFGRKLALARLPDDLLALCHPRQVVIDGTRLSEDVEPGHPLGAREDTLMRPEIKWAAAGGCLTLLALGSVLGIAGGVLTIAARKDVAMSAPDQFGAEARVKGEADMAYPASAPPPPPAEMGALAGAKGGGTADRLDAPSRVAAQKRAAVSDEELREKKKDADGAETGPATRSWFPETFLFQPEVVTDASGNAQVAFMAPDRLTGWRILGLAHDRSGHQSGALTRVQTALDLYVDLVVPRFLVVGDEVVLPVLVVNTSDASHAAHLTVQVSGAGWRSIDTELRVPARSSAVRDVPIRIERADQLTVRATFGDDSIERTVEVLPEGIPAFTERSGTLGAPKRIVLDGDARLDPRTADLRLVVHGGLQSVLEAELASAPDRGQDAASVAYALELLATGTRMIHDLGGETDDEAIRSARIVAAQRAVRLARSPDLSTAGLLADPCSDHAEVPVLASLGERLSAQLQSAQHPDGSFGGDEGGWPLQRLLVATGESAEAASSLETEAGARRKALVMLRAQGTVERYVARIEDPYTAAVLVASGATTGATMEKLRQLVREAVVEEDGQRRLPVPSGVVRADGSRPSEEEATARALQALQGDPEAPWLADLASSLLGSYRPGRGWGDGRTNLAVLEALATAAPEPVKGPIDVTLTRDGQPIGHATLDLQHGQHVVVLQSGDDAPSKAHTLIVTADPPAPGLTFTLTRRAWRPYDASDDRDGLDLIATLPDDVRVGEVVSLELEAAAPAGFPLTIAIPLPAGVDPLPTALASLQAGGVIVGWKTDAGALTLDVPPLSPGGRFQASVPLVATLAGDLHVAPPTLAPAHDPAQATHADPAVWRVRTR